MWVSNMEPPEKSESIKEAIGRRWSGFKWDITAYRIPGINWKNGEDAPTKVKKG